MTELRAVMKLMLVERKDILLSIAFGFLSGISAVGLFANSGYLISKAALLPPLYVLTLSIAFLKLFSVIRAFCRYAERLYSHRATFTILSNIRAYFFKKLETKASIIFNKYRSGDLLSRIVGDVETLQHFFLRVYYPPVVMIIVFLATIIFTLLLSVEIAVILLLGFLVTGFLIPLWFTYKRKVFENSIRSVRGQLSTEITEFMYGFLDLRLNQKLDKQQQGILSCANNYIDRQVMSGNQLLLSQSIIHGVSLIMTWLILAFSAFLVSEHELNGVFLAMLVMISLSVFENATPMATFPSYLEDSRIASKRLNSITEKAKENGTSTLEKCYINRAPSLEIKNVTFHYSGEERATLNEVTLTLPAGSKTAIVGPSGSGKSTLLSLLLKLHKDYRGDIYVWDKNLAGLQDEGYWRGINPVLQNNHFFYGTIRDNLVISRDGVSDEEMKEVLVKVMLSHFTLEDSVLEKGMNLSGGEKQRLAIARAMLKGGSLWLLDEPTSSMDVLTERRIFDQMFEQSKDDTILLVSHRLTGMENMDQIIVMDQGRIIESGTFQELIDQQGYFYKMKQIEKSVFI